MSNARGHGWKQRRQKSSKKSKKYVVIQGAAPAAGYSASCHPMARRVLCRHRPFAAHQRQENVGPSMKPSGVCNSWGYFTRLRRMSVQLNQLNQYFFCNAPFGNLSPRSQCMAATQPRATSVAAAVCAGRGPWREKVPPGDWRGSDGVRISLS